MNTDLNSLHRGAEGVPHARQPFVWDRKIPTTVNMSYVDGAIDLFNNRYRKPVGGSLIDEAAIMVPSHDVMFSLEGELGEAGWWEFNEAEDLVYTNPFGTRYQVEYHFWRHSKFPWRLEVMMLAQGSGRGFSPLHSSLWYPSGDRYYETEKLPMPHLSYKVGSRKEFSQEQERLGEQGSGLVHAQTCQSTYGVFSYWLPTGFGRNLYLKPRANLRDQP